MHHRNLCRRHFHRSEGNQIRRHAQTLGLNLPTRLLGCRERNRALGGGLHSPESFLERYSDSASRNFVPVQVHRCEQQRAGNVGGGPSEVVYCSEDVCDGGDCEWELAELGLQMSLTL
jgi:hypothetical protein